MSQEAPHPRIRPLAMTQARDPQGNPLLVLHDPEGLSPGPAVVGPVALEVIRLLDGNRSVRDIQVELQRTLGRLIDSEEIQGLVDQLRQNLMLLGPELEEARQEDRRRYLRSGIRPAGLSGEAYPSDPAELRAFLDELLANASPPPADASPPRALVAPHIDFQRGGATYAAAYGLLPVGSVPDRVLLLGTSHRPTRFPLVFTSLGYDTPLGRLEPEADAVAMLRQELGDEVFQEEALHREEHSLEFQAVLLAHVATDPATMRILPVLCGSMAEPSSPGSEPGQDPRYRRAVEVLRQILRQWSPGGLVIAGADLAHVGTQFGDPPVTPVDLARIEKQDREMLDLYRAGDAEGFFRQVIRDGDRRKICGLAPMKTLLDVTGAQDGHVTDYRYWHDPEQGSMVSFAAVWFP